MVLVGTPLSSYLSEMRLSVGNVRCISHVTPKDKTMHIALKMAVDDQFEGLSAPSFTGNKMRALSFDSFEMS